MVDGRRDARQTAYRIVVASTPSLLAADRGDQWDTGRVSSSQSLNVIYRGKSLQPRQGCWWKVRIWDSNGQPSAWSKPARWERAIKPNGWRAKWIAFPAPHDFHNLDSIRWIWHADNTQGVEAPAGDRYFRGTVTIPAGQPIESANLLIAVDNGFRAYCNGKQIGSGTGWQGFACLQIDKALVPGRNVIALRATNDTPGPAGLAALLSVRFRGGATATLPTNGDWRTATQPSKGWNAVAFDDSSWTPARVLGPVGMQPWGNPAIDATRTQCSMMRKDFTVSKAVTRARLYVTALGSYRVTVNGARVGHDCLTPDWTDNRIRASYQVYDVTSLVRRGANAIGAILGDGWYGSGLGWGLQRFSMGSAPTRLLAELHVTHADGTETVVATDRTWKSALSPILLSQIYAGETYDARLEQAGWDRPGFNCRGWKPVALPVTPSIQLNAQESPTIQVTGNVKPVSVKHQAGGITVYDMGQNMPGWLRIKVHGKRGTEVLLRCAERLNDDGTIYTENLRKAADTDRYILRGGAVEVFEPTFTYRGFRYVQVTTTTPAPQVLEVMGRVAHTAVPFAGTFATGSSLVNHIQHNIVWGIRSNLHSVPTDCPQRDERLGWMGDAGVIWRTACYEMDMAAFSRKWMRDVIDAQSPAGGFSDVSPRVVDGADGAPAWGDAGIILPWVAFHQYGDAELVRRCWPAMERWMEYIHSANPDLLWLNRRNNDFGDWVPANSWTPKDVIASAYWANDARMMSEMARGIGRKADAERFTRLFDGIREAFTKRYIQADGTVGNGSQTCQALALDYNLAPDNQREMIAAKLVDDVRGRNWHLSTGFVGTSPLMFALTATGNHSVATRLLLNRTYPSWGYMVSKGATTMWERWNGDTGDPGMNSFNHYAYGCVGAWMYHDVAGIDTDPATPGYGRIVIRPHVDPQLPKGHATYQSVRGPITVAWNLANGKLALRVVIPANTTATVYVPANDPAGILESGKPVAKAAGVRTLTSQAGCAVFSVGSGTYRFTAR